MGAVETGHGEPGRATLLPDPEPRPIRVPVISVDDHLIEPPDLFEGRLPAALADGAPRVVEQDGGTPEPGSSRATTTPTSGSTPWWAGPARSGAWTRPASTRCAPAASTSRPASRTWTGPASGPRCASPRSSRASAAPSTRGRRTPSSGWPACAPSTTGTSRCGPGRHPERIIPLQLPWLADVEVAAAEVRANAARGFKAVSFPEFPAQLRPALHLQRALGPLLRRLRGDRHRRVPAHRARRAGRRSPRPTRPSSCCPPSSRSTRCWRPASGCGRACRCASRRWRSPCPRAASAGCPC